MNPIDPIPNDALTLVARACFKHTVSVFFGEPTEKSKLNSASGVLIKLSRPLLVTARHVIEEYKNRKQDDPGLQFQVGLGSIDAVTERIVGWDQNLDLATVDLSGIMLETLVDHLAYHEPVRWPSKIVEVGTNVIVNGFPLEYRCVLNDHHAIKFKSFHLGALVSSVASHTFACVLNPPVHDQNGVSSGTGWPYSYHALSGSPVFAVREAIELVGIVYEANEAYSILKVYHASLIGDDGMLRGSLV